MTSRSPRDSPPSSGASVGPGPGPSTAPGAGPAVGRGGRAWLALLRWFDSGAAGDGDAGGGGAAGRDHRIDWVRIVPFLALHVACLGVVLVGASPVAVGTAAFLYVARMFAVTAFYHRYFSHKTFRTSRFWQFVFAVAGNSAVQKGPLWWAAHHRTHHRTSDRPGDVHSPRLDGFLWSHVGWIGSRANFGTDLRLVPDLARYPELRFLDRFNVLVPLLLLGALWLAGALLEAHVPSAGTTGGQMAVWGFCVSTVVLFHATASINSFAHLVGRRRYATPDDSRNNWFLALLTLGEGWHNNHHHFQTSTRQGFYWWEVDLTWYLLVVLSWLGIVRDLRPVPARVRDARPPAAAPAGG